MPIRSREDLRFYRQADLVSSGIPHWGLIQWLRHDIMRFQRLLRLTEYFDHRYPKGVGKLFVLGLRWILRRRGRRLGLEIPLHVFGPGLAIVHSWGIVISPKARVGKNCRIHAGVNVGEHRFRAPVIGDNVYLGPGAKIVGGVTVGDNAVIGANAVVVKDVPPGVTAGTRPAEIISERDSGEIIPRRGA